MTKKMTKRPKNHKTKQHCFEPNIWSNLHLAAYYITCLILYDSNSAATI